MGFSPLFCGDACVFGDQSLHRAAHVQARGVGDDVDQSGLAQFRQARLLALHHRLVLQERGGDLLEQLLGRGRIIRDGSRWRRTRNKSSVVSVSGVRPWNRRNCSLLFVGSAVA